MSNSNESEELRGFVATAFRGTITFGERFAIYFTNKGRSEIEGEPQVEMPEANWQSWIRRALHLLGEINGGATATAPANAVYIDRNRHNERVSENTVIVYSFIVDRSVFRERVIEVRELINEYGRETRQGSVFFEFDGYAYQIDEPFDE